MDGILKGLSSAGVIEVILAVFKSYRRMAAPSFCPT